MFLFNFVEGFAVLCLWCLNAFGVYRCAVSMADAVSVAKARFFGYAV